MFQSIRPNSQIYVLHKGESPFLETGYVVNQPMPRAKYPLTATFGTQPEMVVDITVKIGEKTVNYTGIPAKDEIADFTDGGESIVISYNKDAMNSEILSLKQKSTDIINSVDYHRGIVESCDKILSEFNPEFAEKKAQQNEINNLRTQMSEIRSMIERLINKEEKL